MRPCPTRSVRLVRQRRGGPPPTLAPSGPADPPPEHPVLHYALVFFVIAVIAALLGFGGIAAGAAGIAKLLALVFIVLAVVSLAADLLRGRR